MFDLKREVEAWSTKADAGRCRVKAADRARLLRRGWLWNGVLWGVLMIAAAYVLAKGVPRGSPARDNATDLVLFVLTPVWLASHLLLARLLRSRSRH